MAVPRLPSTSAGPCSCGTAPAWLRVLISWNSNADTWGSLTLGTEKIGWNWSITTTDAVKVYNAGRAVCDFFEKGYGVGGSGVYLPYYKTFPVYAIADTIAATATKYLRYSASTYYDTFDMNLSTYMANNPNATTVALSFNPNAWGLIVKNTFTLVDTVAYYNYFIYGNTYNAPGFVEVENESLTAPPVTTTIDVDILLYDSDPNLSTAQWIYSQPYTYAGLTKGSPLGAIPITVDLVNSIIY
jgi:hypothetical protein